MGIKTRTRVGEDLKSTLFEYVAHVYIYKFGSSRYFDYSNAATYY